MKIVYRYYITILMLICLTVACLAGIMYFQVNKSFSLLGEASRDSMKSTLVKSYLQESESLAAVLADSLIEPFLVHDQQQYAAQAISLKSIDSVKEVYVYGSDGRLMTDGSYSLDSYNEPMSSIFPIDGLFERKSVIDHDTSTILTTTPVEFDGDLLGGVCVVMSSERIEKGIADLERSLKSTEQMSYSHLFHAGIIVVAGMFFVASILAYWAAHRLSDPLKKFSNAMSKVGRGEFNLDVPAERKDEIGTLSRSILKMTEALQSTTISRDFFNGILYGMHDGILVTDENDSIVIANSAAEKLLDCAVGKAVGKNVKYFINAETLSFSESEDDVANETHGKELRLTIADGSECYTLVSSSLVSNNGSSYRVLILHNITERKKLENELSFRALHDNLTGLANRHALVNRLKLAIARFKRNAEKSYAVLFIDLDRFKYINDTLGHSAGDKLLIEISSRLKDLVRGEDTVCRLGGDEFVVLLDEVADRDAATVVAERVLKIISQPVVLEGQEVVITCSLGVLVPTESDGDVNSVLAKADMAMYEAKKRGRAQYKNYEIKDSVSAHEIFHIETGLRKALNEGHMQVFYQPIINVETNKTESVEALARWIHPEHGYIAPDDFIPIAEDAGLICSVFSYVFEQSVAFQKQVKLEAGLDIRLNINISAHQITNDRFLYNLKDKLELHSVDPGLIVLELTESALINEYDIAKKNIAEIKKLGVGLALDDFGTGHSSLTHVLTLPFDYMKVDKSFIYNIHSRQRSSQIFNSILSMGHALGMDIVAEGVENEADLHVLKDRGCNFYQGYLKCKPLPSEELVTFLRNG